MSRLGVLGGTFNPIHKGHIELGKYCMDSVSLDKIILIPTYSPPHKSDSGLVSCAHRLEMCRLTAQNHPGFCVSDIEIKRGGKSYTYETLNSLKEIYPNDELFLIMGADMFLTLDKWKNPEAIFKSAAVITIPRNNDDKRALDEFYTSVLKPMGAKAYILGDPVTQVSSTYIREHIGEREKIEGLLDLDVFEYITNNNLYRK